MEQIFIVVSSLQTFFWYANIFPLCFGMEKLFRWIINYVALLLSSFLRTAPVAVQYNRPIYDFVKIVHEEIPVLNMKWKSMIKL